MAQYVNSRICKVSNTPQSDVENWKKERYGYITGTRWKTLILFCKTEEAKHELAKKICGMISDVIPEENMKYVKYGIDNEDKLRKILESQIGAEVYEIGLVKSLLDGIFACSVDGILANGDIVEFKTSKKSIPLESYDDFREIDIGYYWQTQNNMAITGSKRCHFFFYSYTDNKIYYRIIPFNQSVWDYLKPQGEAFYRNYIEPIYDNVNKIPKI